MPELATAAMVPTGSLIVYTSFLLFAVLTIWPLVATVARQQWGYTLLVVLLGPLGGLVWIFKGRRETRDALTPAGDSLT